MLVGVVGIDPHHGLRKTHHPVAGFAGEGLVDGHPIDERPDDLGARPRGAGQEPEVHLVVVTPRILSVVAEADDELGDAWCDLDDLERVAGQKGASRRGGNAEPHRGGVERIDIHREPDRLPLNRSPKLRRRHAVLLRFVNLPTVGAPVSSTVCVAGGQQLVEHADLAGPGRAHPGAKCCTCLRWWRTMRCVRPTVSRREGGRRWGPLRGRRSCPSLACPSSTRWCRETPTSPSSGIQ